MLTLRLFDCTPHLTLSDRSILGYFKASNYTSAYDSFLSLLRSTAPNFPLPDATHSDLLEKKWTSIIRMNKRIMDLEAQNQQLKDDLEQAGKGKKIDQSAVLPREPAKHVLRGHRDGVRACKFHPVYSLLATASEDATIKVWSVALHTDASRSPTSAVSLATVSSLNPALSASRLLTSASLSVVLLCGCAGTARVASLSAHCRVIRTLCSTLISTRVDLPWPLAPLI